MGAYISFKVISTTGTNTSGGQTGKLRTRSSLLMMASVEVSTSSGSNPR